MHLPFCRTRSFCAIPLDNTPFAADLLARWFCSFARMYSLVPLNPCVLFIATVRSIDAHPHDLVRPLRSLFPVVVLLFPQSQMQAHSRSPRLSFPERRTTSKRPKRSPAISIALWAGSSERDLNRMLRICIRSLKAFSQHVIPRHPKSAHVIHCLFAGIVKDGLHGFIFTFVLGDIRLNH